MLRKRGEGQEDGNRNMFSITYVISTEIICLVYMLITQFKNYRHEISQG